MTDEELLTARDQAANEAMEDMGVVLRALEREHPTVCSTRFQALGYMKDALDNLVAEAFFDAANQSAALRHDPEASHFAEDYAELQRLRQLQNCRKSKSDLDFVITPDGVLHTWKVTMAAKPMPRYLQKRLGLC